MFVKLYSHSLSRYFLDQDAAIANGTLSGIPINLKVLGIGNGWIVSRLAKHCATSEGKDVPHRTLFYNSPVSSAMEHPTRE